MKKAASERYKIQKAYNNGGIEGKIEFQHIPEHSRISFQLESMSNNDDVKAIIQWFNFSNCREVLCHKPKV